MKIIVLFQVGNINIGCAILDYIHKYTKNYNLFFICSILEELKSELGVLTTLFEIYNIKYLYIFHPNKGMDIGPYLLQLNYIFLNYSSDSFDQIFKIHTKTDQKWRNEMLDQIFQPTHPNQNKWYLPLDMFNVHHINLICDEFKISNIYYDELLPVEQIEIILTDISTNFYCEYYGIKLTDCTNLNTILGYDFNLSHLYSHLIQNKSIPNPSYIIKTRRFKNLKFYAGSIFKISYIDTWNFFSQIDILKLYSYLETGYMTNEKSTYVHAMERIISCFICLQKDI